MSLKQDLTTFPHIALTAVATVQTGKRVLRQPHISYT